MGTWHESDSNCFAQEIRMRRTTILHGPQCVGNTNGPTNCTSAR
jgi:hypothetical protein